MQNITKYAILIIMQQLQHAAANKQRGGGPAGRPAGPPRLRLLDPAPSWDGAPLGGRTLDLLAALAGVEGAAN